MKKAPGHLKRLGSENDRERWVGYHQMCYVVNRQYCRLGAYQHFKIQLDKWLREHKTNTMFLKVWDCVL